MLTELLAENYKSFRRPARIRLPQIAVFLGKNNSGKTAAARLPLLALSALTAPATSSSPVPLQVRDLTYGSSVLELVFGRLPHLPFELGVTLAPRGSAPVSVSFSVQQRQSLSSGQSAFVSGFSASPYVSPISWLLRSEHTSSQIHYSDSTVSGFRGALPISSNLAVQGPVDLVENIALKQLQRSVHLRAIRATLEAIYETRPPFDITRSSGAETPYLLRSTPELLYLVSDWYQRGLKIRGLDIESQGPAFSLVLRGNSEESPNVARAGQGIQQVLPVATYLIGMAHDLLDVDLITIEEPELHLHPAAHGAVADLAVDVAMSSARKQIVIETHSENLLLRLRRRIAEGRLHPRQLGLYWFEHDFKTGSRVREIPVHSDGSVDSWPRGIFAEDLNEVKGIVRAAER